MESKEGRNDLSEFYGVMLIKVCYTFRVLLPLKLLLCKPTRFGTSYLTVLAMLRYEDSATKQKPSGAPFGEGDTNYFDYFEGGGEGGSLTHSRTNVDRSFNSTSSAEMSGVSHSASSSKAVLAALRALQDKIRRLETERSSALDEAAQLRSQLKSQEIESEHSKEKDILHNQKSLQEARISYERVITERDELERNLKGLREQNEQTKEEMEELRGRNSQLEEMKDQAEQRLRELEGHVDSFEGEMDRSQHREKGKLCISSAALPPPPPDMSVYY